jgi:glucose-6-phosphate 1-dehydrogenase
MVIAPTSVVGGQYDKNPYLDLPAYRREDPALVHSRTETFVAFDGVLDCGRRLRFSVRCGKRMPVDRSDLTLVFGDDRPIGVPAKVRLLFRSPRARASQNHGEDSFRSPTLRTDEYEEVLARALAGNFDDFVGWEETLASWAILVGLQERASRQRPHYPNYRACAELPFGSNASHSVVLKT